MAFRGLFIGIDRYESPEANELSCARRDALALATLFEDTLGGPVELLVDTDATRSRIAAAFAALESSSPDDTVVIAFSGHGSDTHGLVAHDSVVSNLPATAVAFDTLAEWFARIPAGKLMLILDCCFSGGVGAKVLHSATKPRDLRSTETRLAQLAGEGRIIFTASSATEEAFEHHGFRHGLLTHFLLQALRGPPELIESGRISIYHLFDYVTEKVKAAAQLLGRTQNPTVRGQLDGGLHWPVFVPGPRYRKAFPEFSGSRATSDLGSLAAFGCPSALIAAWTEAIPSLNALQVSAINDFGLLEGSHVVISAPTSSGKTMVGELAALLHCLKGKRALFLLPLKALVADKRRQFEAVYGGFGIRVVEATGETDDITPLIRARYDIGLLTYEKFAALVLTHPHLLATAGIIVVDEVQMIADASRGANLEFILTLIRMRRREGIEPQLVALSAVIGDANGFEDWLGGRLLRRIDRPVPLAEGVLRADGSFRHLDPSTGDESIEANVVQRQGIKNSAQDWIIPLVRDLVARGEQVIIFREQKSESRSVANYLAAALCLPPAERALADLPLTDASQAHADLLADLRQGVAFHNADLQPAERSAIEIEFRRPDSAIRVIAATTTLAMGVNTPAESVIIVGLQHPGEKPYSVAEYKNLVGRAGRLGYAAKGTSYLLALDPRTEHDFWRRYVTGRPEDLRSRFLDQNTDPRSLIVKVLVATERFNPDGVTSDVIVGFLESSFGSFQASRQSSNWRWNDGQLMAALSDLERHQLIDRSSEGLYTLNELGRLAGQSGAEVASVIGLVSALSGLSPDEITDPALIAATQATVECDEMLFPINAKSTQKEPHAWTSELSRQGVAPAILASLRRTAANPLRATLRAKKAVACLLYMSSLAMADMERVLTQFGGSPGGAAGAIRSIASRTSDLIAVAARVAEVIHPSLDLQHRASRMTIRLTYGVPSETVDLARILGAELLRGDYIELAGAGLCDGRSIIDAEVASVAALLGGSTKKAEAVLKAGRKLASQGPIEAAAPSPLLEIYKP